MHMYTVELSNCFVHLSVSLSACQSVRHVICPNYNYCKMLQAGWLRFEGFIANTNNEHTLLEHLYVYGYK